MVGLYRDPKGETIFGDQNSSATVVIRNDLIRPANGERPNTVAELEQRIQELEAERLRYTVCLSYILLTLNTIMNFTYFHFTGQCGNKLILNRLIVIACRFVNCLNQT